MSFFNNIAIMTTMALSYTRAFPKRGALRESLFTPTLGLFHILLFSVRHTILAQDPCAARVITQEQQTNYIARMKKHRVEESPEERGKSRGRVYHVVYCTVRHTIQGDVTSTQRDTKLHSNWVELN